MPSPRYDTLEVTVDGGHLHVGRWGRGDDVVLAIHGLTLFHVGFQPLAEQLGADVTLVAPDLRGRGGSAGLGPPFGLAAHADDLAAVLEALGTGPAVVVGHSWGAVVALVLAQRHPDLVRAVVLVDGGLPADHGGAGDRPATNPLERVVGRLRTPFPSTEAYLDTWRHHPGLAPYWNEHLDTHFGYELVGEPPALRSSLREDAFVADATDLTEGDLADRALRELRHPATFARAPRGMLDDPVSLYGEDRVRVWQERVPQLRDVLVPDVNHYTILFTDGGARAIADIIREELLCTTS